MGLLCVASVSLGGHFWVPNDCYGTPGGCYGTPGGCYGTPGGHEGAV